MTSTKPLRADAQRNRDKLLAVAAETFASHGSDVSLEKVAKRAGVGIGTLYRHFPTREALVEAVYLNEVDQLHGAAAGLVAELPADEALAEWMRRFITYASTKRGMASVLHQVAASKTELFAPTKGRLTDALRTLLDAGVRDGVLRDDMDAEDVWRAMAGVWTGYDEPDWRERAERLVTIVVAGLRT